MNNSNAARLINSSKEELVKIGHFKEVVGSTHKMMAFSTRYAIIKCCGTIEQCFKGIISDFFSNNSSNEAIRYIEKNFRESSINPTYDNIRKSLKQFNEVWDTNFHKKVDELENVRMVKESLSSLNKARNTFAHGGSPTNSFDDVTKYFEDAVKIIKILDEVIVIEDEPRTVET